MKRKISVLIMILVFAASTIFLAGCNDSNSDSTAKENKIVEITTLGVYGRDEPVELTQSAYRISPSETTYASFSISENTIIGYMIADGTFEIYNQDGSPAYSDVFYPLGNSWKTVSLQPGTYLARIQNSEKDQGSFTIFSKAIELDCTTIRSGQTILVPEKSSEFIVIEAESGAPVDFRALIQTGRLTLFDSDYNELVSASSTINRSLSEGRYILLADNSGSRKFGKLEIEMD